MQKRIEENAERFINGRRLVHMKVALENLQGIAVIVEDARQGYFAEQ